MWALYLTAIHVQELCYSPTNVSDETDVITFYSELSSLVRDIPKHTILNIDEAIMKKTKILLSLLYEQK